MSKVSTWQCIDLCIVILTLTAYLHFFVHSLGVSVAVGALFGLAGAMGTVIHYVPSAISTFFRFRGGEIPALRDIRKFHPYRFAQVSSRLARANGSLFS